MKVYSAIQLSSIHFGVECPYNRFERVDNRQIPYRIIIMNQAHMRTACDRVHIHKHMQNEVNKAIISMGSGIVNGQVN